MNGDITLYTVSVDDEKLQTLLEGAQNLGAANLYSYLSAFEGIRIPQVQTEDAQECHSFFDMVDGKDGVCEFALCIESDLEGGQVAMGYQSDMGVSQLTEEELRKVNRANIAQVIEENGLAEYLPCLYGDMPYVDAIGEAEWNEKRLQAPKKEEEWIRQGIDANAVENYYYYLCGLETIAASAMRAEEEGFRRSLESFVLKYIGNMASNAYEQVCYITGTTIDKDIAWYVPIGMEAIIGASVADLFVEIGKVRKVYKETTTNEVVEEVAEDVFEGDSASKIGYEYLDDQLGSLKDKVKINQYQSAESVNDWWEARGYKASYKEKTVVQQNLFECMMVVEYK